MNEHPHGAPYTRATYTHGCRCQRCKDANAAYMREKRAEKNSGARFNSKAQGIASAQAAAWVRHNHPDVWDQLLKEAKRRVRAADNI
jgi:hypothetical protein